MPPPITKSCLSAHDQQVLDSIFNPLELTSALAPQLIDANSTQALVDNDDDRDECSTELLEKSKALEIEAVKLTEGNQLEAALKQFDAAMALTPKRASIYNNRAQALRIMARDEDAFADLTKAIELGATQFKTKCHALCQRGVLYRKQEKLDEARADFEEASKMGSQFAKTQLVEINPFAALCNQMLRQAFEQLK